MSLIGKEVEFYTTDFGILKGIVLEKYNGYNMQWECNKDYYIIKTKELIYHSPCEDITNVIEEEKSKEPSTVSPINFVPTNKPFPLED